MIALIIGVTFVILVGGLIVASAGHGEGLPPRDVDDPPIRLPESDLVGEDVKDIRFSTAVRGYRMSEVDDVLSRLAREIDDLRARVTPFSDR